MATLFDSGRIVEWILALIVVEAIVMGVFLWTRRRGFLYGLWMNLAAGALLLLALRAVLTGAGWPMAAAWLAAAGLVHIGDLVLRFRAAQRAD